MHSAAGQRHQQVLLLAQARIRQVEKQRPAAEPQGQVLQRVPGVVVQRQAAAEDSGRLVRVHFVDGHFGPF